MVALNPYMLQWNWTLEKGANFKVEIIGRWTPHDAEVLRDIVGMICDVIDTLSEPSPEPKPQDTPHG